MNPKKNDMAKCQKCEDRRKIQASCEVCKYSDVDCCTSIDVWCYNIPCPLCRPNEYKDAIDVEKADPVKSILKNLGKLGVTEESFEGKLVKKILSRR